ncbi:MAG: two-component system nitrogen regulation response regulator GlnG [Glaciecola sp.]|jgi:two-component system nitrogen regulation response regulator GlnG
MSKPVWIVDDDSSIRWVLEKALNDADINCLSFDNPEDLLLQIQSGQAPMVIISDVRMPQMDGMQLLEEVHKHFPELPFIIMTAHSDLDSAVNAYQGGAFEYLPKPFDVDEAVALTQRALEHAKEYSSSTNIEPENPSKEIIGAAPAMQEVFRAIGRLSRSSISVLINGQSGSGKELVAQALHKHSPRARQSFVALNMAAIPTELVESELFGHEKGAFTGAQNMRTGRFEQADGGTLFLDEIGDMPVGVQTRLLRVLADGQFYRVGGHHPVSVDVRIIAATHQNLEQKVADGSFREDLYHRLNVIKIHIPSLNERREDIPLLAKHFLVKAAKELGVDMKSLSEDAAQKLTSINWPGNVRQLENTCRWLTVMASGQEIKPSDFPPELSSSKETVGGQKVESDWTVLLADWADDQLQMGENDILDQALLNFERVLLDRALHHTHGHKQEAAKRLGWGRNTLTRKLKELNIS